MIDPSTTPTYTLADVHVKTPPSMLQWEVIAMKSAVSRRRFLLGIAVSAGGCLACHATSGIAFAEDVSHR